MANNTIQYNVDFSVNKNGLNQLKTELQSVKTIAQQALSGVNTNSLNLADQELRDIINSATHLEGALNRAFNTNLGTLNVSKFNQELQKLNLNKIQSDFAKIGATGQNAFRNMTTQVLTTNMQLKQTYSLVDSMAQTMGNTIKWGIASSIMNTFVRSVQNAYGYVKKLDTSLNNIMLVTDKSADNMKEFAKQANIAAKELGASTTAYTDAALIYYQQGLGDKEVAARAETTLKAANVTGQTGEEVSEQLTAVWNGYKVSAEETEIYVDKLAKVASTTASNLEELSTGMSKVASAASSMGVDIDQLNAQLATIISVTRQAPESAGTALKTIYARMGDLAVDGEDEFGVSLGEVSGKMAQMGVQILDQQGELREMGEVIEEVAGKWQTWTEAQKQAAAVAMAGKRQYNNLIALFENWDMYEKALNTSANSVGFLQSQQDEYMDSMQAHLQTLKTTTESLHSSLIDSDSMNELVDGLTVVVGLFNQFVQSIGGGGNLLLGLGAIGMKVFNKQIASGLTKFILNLRTSKENATQLRAEMEMLGQFENLQKDDPRYQRIISMKKQELEYSKVLSAEEKEISAEYIRQTNELFKQQDALNERKMQAEQTYAQMFQGETIDLNVKGAGAQASKDLGVELTAFQQEQREIANSTTAYKEYVNVLMTSKGNKDALKDATQNYLTVAEEELNQAYALLQSEKLSEEQEQRLAAAIASYTQAQELSAESDELVAETVTAGNTLHEEYSQILSEIIKKLTQAKKTADSYEQEFDDLNNKVENGRVAFSRFISTAQMKSVTSGIVQAVGSFGQLAMAINSLSTIKDTFNNNNLSTMEKTTQIVMSLTMAFSSLTFGLKGVKAGYDSVAKLIQGVNSWLTASVDLTDNQVIRQNMLNLAKERGITLDEKELTVDMAKTLQGQLEEQYYQDLLALRMLNNEQIDAETEAELREMAATKAGLAMQEAEIVQDNIETATSKKKTKQLWAEVAAKMAKHWYILVIIAALATLAAITYAVVKAQNKEADALKEASENAKKAKEEFKSLQEELANFNSNVEKYSELKDALYGLTEGTDEYKRAVMELNAEVLELMSKYPILTQYLENNNGVLGINAEGWTQVYQAQLDAANAAYINTLDTQIDEMDAQMELNIKRQAENSKKYIGFETNSTPDDDGSGGSTYTTARTGTLTKAELMAFGEAYLTHGNAFFEDDSIIKSLYANAGQPANEKLVSALTASTDSIYEAVVLDEYSKEEVIESQNKLRAEIIKAALTIQASTIATNQLRQQKYDSFIENGYLSTLRNQTKVGEDISKESKIYAQYSSLGAGEQSAVASLIGQYEKENVQDVGEWKNDGWLFNWAWTSGAKSDKEKQKAYAEAMGYDTSKTENKTGKAVYYRPGSDEGVEVSDKYISEFLNDRAKSAIAVTEYGQQAMKIVNTMSSAASDSAKNLGYDEEIQEEAGDLLAGHFAGVSNLGLASDESLKAIQGMSEEAIAGMITDEQAKNAGYADATAYAKALHSEVEYQLGEGAEARAAAIAKKAQEEYNTALEQGAKELDMSKDALDGYAKYLMKNNAELAKNKKAAAEAAVAHAKFSKGIDKLRDVLEDSIEVLEEWDEDALETYEASAKVEEALKDVFGVDVDADFVKENLDDIKGLAEGSEESLNRLSVALAKKQVMDLTIESSTKDEINAVIDELDALRNMPDAEIGMTFDDSDFINKMNKLLENGDITAEQLQGILNSVGFKPDLKMKTIEGKPTTTKQKIYGDIFGNRTKLAEYEIETTNSVQVPYIAAEGTEMAADASGFGGQESGSGLTMTSTADSLIGSLGNNITDSKIGESSGDPDKMDFLEDERDLYHDINMEIEKLEKQYEKLEAAQEKLYGKDLINNLQEQLELLEKQEDAQKRKLIIAEDEKNTLQNSLKSQGVTFDEEGQISNYATIYEQKKAHVNNLISQYNSMDKASQDNFKPTVEAAQKDFEQFIEDMERYDELIGSEIPEIEQTLRDIANKEIEKQIEAFEYEITLKLDMREAQRDWNEFKKNMTVDEDDILGSTRFAFDNFKTYMGDNGTIATLTNKSNTLLDQLKQINETGTSSIYGDNKAKLMEDLQAVQEQLMEEMQNQKDILDEIEEAYVNMLDAAQEAFDEQIAQYEAINEVYSHGLNVINLMYGEDAYAEMEDYYKKQMDNNNKMIDMQRDTVNFYKQQLENASLTDKQREEVQRKLQEAQAALHASVESQVELIITKYTNAINKIFKELEDKMTGGMGLSHIQEEWDLINQNAEMYLDQINSAYEIEKLTREYNKAIDATSSLSAQRKLNELMEQQLKGLREKDKLTQYEVDRANALLDIELKKIALEEAQQNKSKMRLRRDASGNYSYQFVSDEDATAQAQQELADAQNSLYNLDKDALQENQEAALNMWTEFKDKYIEILSDVTLTDEEREARLQLIREQYGEMYNNLLLQNADIRKNLEETALTEMSQMNLDYMMNDIVPTWDTGVQQMMDAFTGEGGLLPACSTAFNDLKTLVGEYDADLALLEQNAGYSLGQIATYTQTVAEQMTPVLKDNDELISKYATQIEQLGLITDAVTGLKGEYNLLTTAATSAADAILKARYAEAGLDEEGNPLPELNKGDEDKGKGDDGNKIVSDDGKKNDGDKGKEVTDNSSKAEGVAATIWLDGSSNSGWGTGNTRASRLSAKGVAAAQSIINSQGPSGALYKKWWKKDRSAYKYGAFETGGYTGEWGGDDGRLAILHQKELVLNADDTKNILQAVDIVRHIDGIMESVMGNAFSRINNQINGLNAMNIPIGGPTSSEAAVAQHIEINADFPGVERASEIISAFENLTNMATQYAFRSDR